MTLARLVVEQQFASLGINMTNAKMTVSTNVRRPEVSYDPADAAIQQNFQEQPAFELDFSRFSFDRGLLNVGNTTLLTQNQQQPQVNGIQSQGFTAVGANAQAVSSTAAVGANGLPLESAVQPVVVPRYRSATPQPIEHDGAMQPDITWKKNSIDVNWQGHSVNIEWSDDFMPQVSVDPRATVEVFLRNQSKITITVEGWPPDFGDIVDFEA
jgi:hypothetical protein